LSTGLLRRFGSVGVVFAALATGTVSARFESSAVGIEPVSAPVSLTSLAADGSGVACEGAFDVAGIALTGFAMGGATEFMFVEV